jgi:aminoglycoside 2''-phosphotransferase
VRPEDEIDVIAVAVTSALPPRDRAQPPRLLMASATTLAFVVGETVVRTPRDEVGSRRQELENRLLPVLAGRLSAAVAGPLTVIEPSDDLPFGAVTYPLISGRAMAPGDEDRWPAIAPDLAHLLASVHSTPVARAHAAGVPTWDAVQRMPALAEASAASLAASLSEAQRASFGRRWADAAAILEIHPPASVLCHGDPWYDNLLIDPTSGRIVAILDFQHAVIADAALDLAAVYEMGDAFGDAVAHAYQERRGRDAALASRVRAHRLIRAVQGVADAGEDVATPDQVAKIAHLFSDS